MIFGDFAGDFNGARLALSQRLVGLGRHSKRGLLVTCDLMVLYVSLWLAFAARYGWGFHPKFGLFLLTLLVPIMGVAAFAQAGLYRMVTRYIGGHAISRIAMALLISILVWSLLIVLTGLDGTPRGAMIIYWIMGSCGTLLIRQIAARILMIEPVISRTDDRQRIPVLVWGAGPVGLQLATALERSDRYLPFGLVDLNANLWGQYVGGYKVYRPERVPGLIQRVGIKEVMLAIQEASRHDRAEALRYLETQPVVVRVLPPLDEMARGKVAVSKLRAVEAEDLLGRDQIAARPDLMARNVRGKSVMVTGAGGRSAQKSSGRYCAGSRAC